MNVDWDLLGLKHRQAKPVKGDLLVAAPFLNESFFRRGVICLVEHEDEQSTLGLVMNHRTPFSLSDVMPEIDVESPIPLYCGGPMSNNRLFYLHTLNDVIPNSVEVMPGLYVNGDLRVVKSYINAGRPVEGCIRFFVGYSGWDKGQLVEEIDAHTWGVMNPDMMNLSKYLSRSGNRYWCERVQEMGADYRGWLMCPTMPMLN